LQGRQAADEHDGAVRLLRPVLGPAQAFDQVFLVVGEAVAGDQPGAGVELEVELAELGLEGRVGQVGQDLGVAHRRFGVRVHEVELDLEARHRALRVEGEVVQHQSQHVEAAPDLLPIVDPVVLREDDP
jgi:hypothetical protein